ncbi:MAG: EpsG family protein [Ruminococcus sp.]|uniref:EpsG family protein n=1 Tax=Ruminococcus sp. TaxID=41978 RepID=UPI001B702BEF|nr:EpsG family protein [Ruminococcus sp.]MBP5579364.1 EpsG family protein [Ruminococcus sp.]
MSEALLWMENTFFIERLCGVIVYTLITLYYYNRLKNPQPWETPEKTLNKVMIFLCVLAFFYIPAESADLSRWRTISEGWIGVPFGQWADTFLKQPNSPLAYLLFYVTANLKIKGLLPLTACFVFYLNIFHILKSEAGKKHITTQSIAVCFFFFMSQGLFLGVISGLRNAMAFSIVARCMYDELVLKKHSFWYVILCFAAAMIHVAVIPLIGMYFVITIYDTWSDKKKWRTALKVLEVLVLGAVSYRLGRELLDSITKKAEYYTSGTSYSYMWEYIIGIASYLILVYTMLHYRKLPDKSNIKGIYVCAVALLVMEAVLVRSYSIFHRYGNFSMYIMLPMMAVVLEEEKKKDPLSKSSRYESVVMFTSSFMLLLACFRGDLCGFKFFLLP